MTTKVRLYNALTRRISEVEKVEKSLDEWAKILTPKQLSLTHDQKTQKPFYRFSPGFPQKEGLYGCVCCGNHLFRYSLKFDTGKN